MKFAACLENPPTEFFCITLPSMEEFFTEFLSGLKTTSGLEYIAVFTGIASVWFSRAENILVYPVGLVNTIIYVYLSFDRHLIGEAGVNFYYTVMSIYGWLLWARRDHALRPLVRITYSSNRQWKGQLLYFAGFYVTIFLLLTYLKRTFYPGAIPWGDAFASATAFTGMWLMARKKVESWYWWIATNIASIPLYFVKGLVFTSVYYFVLLIFAFWGLNEWRRKARTETAI
jgi:nicotinamide mononucleotide transporter